MEIKLPQYFGEVMENVELFGLIFKAQCANVLVAQNKRSSHYFQFYIPNVSVISISRYCTLDIQCPLCYYVDLCQMQITCMLL